MENNRLGRLAGIADILEEGKKKKSGKKWSGKVSTKWTPPEGFFTNSSTEIVKGLLAAPGGHAKAMSRLNFYINRAGDKLEGKDKARLDDAKDKLSKKLAALKEEQEMFARRAGVVIEKKHDDEDADPDMDFGGDDAGDFGPDADADAHADKGGKAGGEEEEEALPKIVLKIAKKAVGKDEEALADLLMKVYDAGFKDGVKSTEEEEPKDKGNKDAKVDDSAEGDDKDAKKDE